MGGVATCAGCGGQLAPWRNQTLVTNRESPRVVRRLYRCESCGDFESHPIRADGRP